VDEVKVSQGNVSWVVQHLTDGSLSWALRAYHDGEQAVVRGISGSEDAAKRDIAAALVGMVLQPQSPTASEAT
jgi:hypothetical protein